MNPNSNNAQLGKQMVYDTLESGITPLVFDYRNVVFFGKETSVVRTSLVVNSLDVGSLSFSEYRYVARRSRAGVSLVKRHVEKLLRLIPKFLEKYPQIQYFTIPVFPRMILDGELTRFLYDAFATNPDVYPDRVCLEVSADILYEEIDAVKARLDEIRDLGVRVAISEVGDEFCPLFKLNQLPFDLILLDPFATALLDRPESDRLLGSMIQYLRSFGVPVIAPDLESGDQVAAAKRLECDGYSAAEGASPASDETEEEDTEEEAPEEETPEEEATEETPEEEAPEETPEEAPEETTEATGEEETEE